MQTTEELQTLPHLAYLIPGCHDSNTTCDQNYLQYLNSISDPEFYFNLTDGINSSHAKLNGSCVDLEHDSFTMEGTSFFPSLIAVLATVGLSGNLVSCLVIILHLMKFSGTFVLFLLLSLADSFVVVMQTIDIYVMSFHSHRLTLISLEDIGTPLASWKQFWRCKLFPFLWHLGLQLSAWLIMALSVDRYASLKHLYMTHSRRFLYRRAWFIGAGILIFLILLNLPIMLYKRSTIHETSCGLQQICVYFDYRAPPLPEIIPLESNISYLFTHYPEEHVDNNQLTSQQISIWFSRQHFFVFGIIPYTVTIIFNLLLIRYLHSTPHAHFYNRTSNGSNNVHLAKTTRIASRNSTKWYSICNPNCLSRNKSTNKTNPVEQIDSATNQASSNNMAIKQSEQPVPNHQPHQRMSSSADKCYTKPNQIMQTLAYQNAHTWDGAMNLNSSQKSSSEQQNTLTFTETMITQTYPECCQFHKCCRSKLILTCGLVQSVQHSSCPNQSDSNEPSVKVSITSPAKAVNWRSMTVLKKPPDPHQRRKVSSGWFVGQTRTTVLLLVVTFTFVGLTLPYLIFVELKQCDFLDPTVNGSYHSTLIIDNLCKFLYFLNNVFSSLLYMAGRRFRKGFYRVMYRIKIFILVTLRIHPPKRNRWYPYPPNQFHPMKYRRSNDNVGFNVKHYPQRPNPELTRLNNECKPEILNCP